MHTQGKCWDTVQEAEGSPSTERERPCNEP